MTARRPRMPAPIRIVTTPMQDGARQVVLACSCVSVGRLFQAWESEDDAIAQLRRDHEQRAPACRHPWLPGGTPKIEELPPTSWATSRPLYGSGGIRDA
jgi:hypothetical protein